MGLGLLIVEISRSYSDTPHSVGLLWASDRPVTGNSTLERGGSSTVGRAQAGRPDHKQQQCYHHAPTVKPEAATAVVELLMMGVRRSKYVELYINVK